MVSTIRRDWAKQNTVSYDLYAFPDQGFALVLL